MSLSSINPATDEILETFPETSERERGEMLARSHAAFHEWRTVPVAARAERMRGRPGSSGLAGRRTRAP